MHKQETKDSSCIKGFPSALAFRLQGVFIQVIKTSIIITKMQA